MMDSIDDLAKQGIPYVPFFPLGGFTPLQSSKLDAAAASLDATPMQIALAWLLWRAPNILLIPGTSSVAHLRENLEATTLQLPPEIFASLDSIQPADVDHGNADLSTAPSPSLHSGSGSGRDDKFVI